MRSPSSQRSAPVPQRATRPETRQNPPSIFISKDFCFQDYAKGGLFSPAQLISSGLSSKILKEALDQQKEILQEVEEESRVSLSAVAVDPLARLDSDAEDIDEFDGFTETQSLYDADDVSPLHQHSMLVSLYYLN